jgi:hypothetical protein
VVKGPFCGRAWESAEPGFWPVDKGPVCDRAKGTLSTSQAQTSAILWNDGVIGSVKL